jgi:hypothetical protein
LSAVGRPLDESEAIASLVEKVPELRPLLDQHVADNDELLPYVVFESDFIRWLVDRVRSGDLEPAERFVAAVEPLLATGVEAPATDRVHSLAWICFVEGLVMQGFWDDVIETARPWMGPVTTLGIDWMFRYRSGELPADARPEGPRLL